MKSLFALLALTGIANAAPLPEGLHFETDKQHEVYLVRGRDRVHIALGAGGIEGNSVDASYDKKTRIVTLDYAPDCLGATTKTFPLDTLKAHLDNAIGYRLLEGGKTAEATTHFVSAVQLDPDFDLARTNLASAYMRARDSASALKALAPMTKSRPAVLYAKVVTDPDLAVLADLPAMQALRASTPGTAKIVSTSKDPFYATAGGLVAFRGVHVSWGNECYTDSFLNVMRSSDGAIVAELPLGGTRPGTKGQCKATPEREAHVLMANRFLADMGFVSIPFESATIEEVDTQKRKAFFPQAKLGVVATDTLRVLRGDTTLASIPFSEGRLAGATYFSSLKILVADWSDEREGCRTDHAGTKVVRVP